jgi:hypothetical protein
MFGVWSKFEFEHGVSRKASGDLIDAHLINFQAAAFIMFHATAREQK